MKNRTVYITAIGTGAIVLTAAVCVVGGFLGGAVDATEMPARPSSFALPTGPALLTASAGPIDVELTVDGPRVLTQVHDDGELQTVGGDRRHAGLRADRVLTSGGVSGGEAEDTHHAYGVLVGQAGTDVTAVSVVADGHRTAAVLRDGQWAAVWTVRRVDELPTEATIRYATRDGAEHRVSTAAVDDVRPSAG
ncbi:MULTISPECIES: hypothetical protein [unclassified Curtobacterium]|uniref:hypothetical protein n=1 Tax=unclassified Curtobacterium TaxID=257496 RepID=UPI00226B729B|nr:MULTISPECIES: hypothetical protein [unclassified Curtobacterium]